MTIPVFPTLSGLAYPVKRTAVWSSIKQQAVSGKSTVLALFTYPLWRWELSFSALGSGAKFLAGTNNDFQTLVGFFNSAAGQALPFHYQDDFDKSVTGQGLGTGDGTTRNFNFVRALGGFVEPTQDVTQSGVVIYDNGTPTVAYTFLTDANWGFTYGINFNSAPTAGHVITADFNYRWPCQFTQDTTDFTEFLQNFWDCKKLAFESMKVV